MRRPWILLAVLLAACGSSADAVRTDDPPAPTPRPTIGDVGVLAPSVPTTAPPKDDTPTEPLVVISRPVTPDGVLADLVGQQVRSNRLLLIGDSIFAGTETRYGGEMCAGLEPLGWAVEVAAEAGRFVEFGVKVVDRIVPEADVTTNTADAAGGDDQAGDWDAAGVFLGSNYDGDEEEYEAKLREILDRLAPRPTLLYTVTEYRANYTEVNEVIRRLAVEYPNVTLIEWGEAAKTPGVLSSDRLHPVNAGEQVLVELTAAALGKAPSGEADCIRSQFRDDSAIKKGNGKPNTNTGGSSSTGSGSSSTGGGSSTTGNNSTSTVPRKGSSSPTTVNTTTGSPTTTPGSTSGGSARDDEWRLGSGDDEWRDQPGHDEWRDEWGDQPGHDQRRVLDRWEHHWQHGADWNHVGWDRHRQHGAGWDDVRWVVGGWFDVG